MPHPWTERLLRVLGPTRLLLAGGDTASLLADLLPAGCDAYAIWLGNTGKGADDNAGGAAPPHQRYRQLPEILTMAGSFDTLIVEAKTGTEPLAALQQLFQYTGMPLNLVLAAWGHERRKLESGLFLLGWRRHPGVAAISGSPTPATDLMGELSFYQRVPSHAMAG